jgi:hypothetical protein
MMISFWHLTAVCCIPQLNPERRSSEREIFRAAAADAPRRASTMPPIRGRWELHQRSLAGKR